MPSHRFTGITSGLFLAVHFSLMAQLPPASIKLSPRQEAEVAFNSGQLNDALNRVNQLLTANPDDATLLLLKGRILIKQASYQAAQDSLFAASNHNPNLHEVHYYLGNSSFLQGRWGEALQFYRIYLKQIPGNREALLKVIYCYLAAGDLNSSSRLITSLDPADDQAPTYYFARAALAFATGKTAAYQETLQQARTIYGNDVYNQYEPDLLFTLKNISLNKK